MPVVLLKIILSSTLKEVLSSNKLYNILILFCINQVTVYYCWILCKTKDLYKS